MLRVDGVREIQLAAAYLGRLDRPTRAAIRAEAKRWAPMLRREVIVKASSREPPAMAVARSGTVSATNKGLVATFGAVGRFRSGGRSIPLERFTGYEFGADRARKTRYVSRQRTSGKATDVYRATRVQMPPRRRAGYFVFPALADATPTLVAMWVRAIADVARGGPAGA